jgi:hypothetical protein
MTTPTTPYRDLALAQLDGVPDEYLPYVVQFLRSFRESVRLKPAGASFRQGWEEARRGDTYPISTLWDDVDVE